MILNYKELINNNVTTLMKFYPLISAQKSIWMLQEIFPDSPFFNIGGYALLKGNLNVDSFKKALYILIDENDGLRIQFRRTNEEVLQYLTNGSNSKIAIIDFTNENNSAETCEQWIKDDMHIPFKDSELVNIALLKAEDDLYYWHLKIHHILSDGFSVALIFNRVSILYSLIEQGQEFITNKKKSYLSFIEEEQQYYKSPEYENDRQFWKTKFDVIPPPVKFELAEKKEKIALTSKRIHQIIDSDTIERVKLFCKEKGIALSSYFISTLYILIKKIYFIDDFVIGFPVLNRNSSQHKNTIGLFLNILPLRLNFGHIQSITELLSTIRKNIYEAVRHQRYPIYNINNDLGKGIIYNILFSYQKDIYNTHFHDLDVELHYLNNGQQNDDLMVHVLEFNNQCDVELVFDYKIKSMSNQSATLLINGFLDVVTKLPEYCDICLNDYELFGENEANGISSFRFKV